MFDIFFIVNFNHICKVIESCETLEQLENAHKWGVDYIKRTKNKTMCTVQMQCTEQFDDVTNAFIGYIDNIYRDKYNGYIKLMTVL